MINKVTIVQVLGDLNKYYRVKYCLKDRKKVEKSFFSSIAYSKLINQDVRFLFYVPESIIVQIVDDISILKKYKKFPNRIYNYYKQRLQEKFPKSIDFDLRIIPSIGSYSLGKDGESKFILTFDNYIDNIITKILLDLINVKCKLIFDISTGLNIYTHSLTEVIKSLIVFHKLKNIFQKNEEYNVKLLIIPPIFKANKENTFPIEAYDFKAKAFFDFPYKNLDINNNLISFSNLNSFKKDKKTVCKNAPKLNKNSQELIQLARLSFNAIKYNIPLAFFERKLIDFNMNQNIVNSELERIKNINIYLKEYSEMKINGNQLIIHNLKVLKTDVINYIFTIALFDSFKKFFEEIKDEKPNIYLMKSKFSELYNYLGLGSNTRFLERDLKTLEKMGLKLEINKIKSLNQLMEKESKEPREIRNNEPVISDEKRNFFAHSGFQRNLIELKKNEKNEVEVYFIENFLETIRSWLLNPEK